MAPIQRLSLRANAPALCAVLLVGVFFFVALLYPLSFSLIEAVREPASGHWTLKHLLRIFAPDAPQWRWILNSLLLAGVVTLSCACIAYPLAYLQARSTFWKQRLLSGLLLVPLVLPPFVGAIGLRRMLAKYGALNLGLMHLGLVNPAQPIDFLDNFRFFGVALVMILHFYPLIYLNLVAAISNIDPSLFESAKGLGAGPWRTFRKVLLPLSWPGLAAGGSLVFIGAFTDLGTPLIFGYQETVARQIYSLANEQVGNPAAPALVAVVTGIVLLLFLLARRPAGWSAGASGGAKGQARGERRRLSGTASLLAVAGHILIIGLALLPHLAVLLSAIGERWFMTALPPAYTTRNLSEALSHPLALASMRNSLLYSFGSTSLDVLLGLLCAWAIARRGGWLGRLLDIFSLAPLAVPGLVLAFGYVGAYARIYSGKHALGSFTFEISVGVFLIMSYAVRRLPYTVRACVAGPEQTPRVLEEAASGLGAKPGAVLRRITLPLILPSVVAGGILAFSFAMLEVSDSIILATKPADYPLTKAIYALFANPGNGDQLASALGLVALLFLALSLLAAGAFLGKKWGQLFN
jgi:iron(III) transport system permease protein